MARVTIQQTEEQGVPMWHVESDDYPQMAPRYAQLETVLGLLGARARDWERLYIVTIIKPEVPARQIYFDGGKMQKAEPTEWAKAA